MLGIVNQVRCLKTVRPTKYTIVALAVLGAIVALRLLTGVYAGEPVDGSY